MVAIGDQHDGWEAFYFDLLIAFAYFSIPCQLIYFGRVAQVQKIGQSIRFQLVVGLYASFIVLCGFSHLLMGLNLPLALVIVKGITCVVSLLTALVSFWTIPPVIAAAIALDRELAIFSSDAVKAARERKELLKAKQETEVFMNFVCHEIRNPLQIITANTEFLGETQLTSEQTELVSALSASTQLMVSIVNDVLDLSRLDAGRLITEMSDFDLMELVSSLVRNKIGEAHTKRMDIATAIDPIVPRRVRSDARRLYQVLLNLLSNAVKYSDVGTITITVRVVDSVKPPPPSHIPGSPLGGPNAATSLAIAASAGAGYGGHLYIDDVSGTAVADKLIRAAATNAIELATKVGGVGGGIAPTESVSQSGAADANPLSPRNNARVTPLSPPLAGTKPAKKTGVSPQIGDTKKDFPVATSATAIAPPQFNAVNVVVDPASGGTGSNATKSKPLCIEFGIIDHGSGIDKPLLAQLFQPFTQGAETATGQGLYVKQAGSGLGLSIVRRLVAVLGGTITVHSQTQKGSIFALRFPFEAAITATPQQQVVAFGSVMNASASPVLPTSGTITPGLILAVPNANATPLVASRDSSPPSAAPLLPDSTPIEMKSSPIGARVAAALPFSLGSSSQTASTVTTTSAGTGTATANGNGSAHASESDATPPPNGVGGSPLGLSKPRASLGGSGSNTLRRQVLANTQHRQNQSGNGHSQPTIVSYQSASPVPSSVLSPNGIGIISTDLPGTPLASSPTGNGNGNGSGASGGSTARSQFGFPQSTAPVATSSPENGGAANTMARRVESGRVSLLAAASQPDPAASASEMKTTGFVPVALPPLPPQTQPIANSSRHWPTPPGDVELTTTRTPESTNRNLSGGVHTAPVGPVTVSVPTRRPRVLVVDDRDENRRVLTRMIIGYGFDVDTANDGQQAIDRVRDALPPGGAASASVIDLNAHTVHLPTEASTGAGGGGGVDLHSVSKSMAQSALASPSGSTMIGPGAAAAAAVSAAANGGTRSTQYAMILIDIQMPVKGGIAATKEIRALGVGTPIIAMSGSSRPSEKDECLAAGMTDYQTKPVSRSQIIALLGKYAVNSTPPLPSGTVLPSGGASAAHDSPNSMIGRRVLPTIVSPAVPVPVVLPPGAAPTAPLSTKTAIPSFNPRAM